MPLLVAAGALFRDAGGRVFLVKPREQPEWDIPGGPVKPGETPAEACAREVAEELGLTITVGPALVVDGAPDRLLFVFDTAPLTDADLAKIQTAGEYVATTDLDKYVAPGLARRLRAAQPGEIRYLTHGPPSH